MSTVYPRQLPPTPIDRREILRYMGCKSSTPEIEGLIDRSLTLCEGVLGYSVCYAEYAIRIEGDVCHLGLCTVESRDLARRLSGCQKILVLAATVGLGLDRLILRYGKREPSVSVCLQAIGTERIEALCDTFCEQMAGEYALLGHSLRTRFSAGYGDLPLSVQKDIFRALCCERHIGLTLSDSLMMSPTKSVTAIIGIE